MRRWFGLILVIAVAVFLALVASWMLRSVLRLADMSAKGGDAVPDPQFAETAGIVTRPPEANDGEVPVVSAGEDPSENWVYETLTPVEQTAAELAEAS